MVFRFVFDPTVLFTVGCLSVAPILKYVREPELAAIKVPLYFTDPAMLAGFVALIFGILLGGSHKRLSRSETRLALWFLLNGAFIHITMDG